MSARTIEETERRGFAIDELANVSPTSAGSHAVRRIGRVRIPLTLTHQPWATLYRLPDGRHWWIVRLWELDHAVSRLFSTATLRRYAAANRLVALAAEIERLDRLAREVALAVRAP